MKARWGNVTLAALLLVLPRRGEPGGARAGERGRVKRAPGVAPCSPGAAVRGPAHGLAGIAGIVALAAGLTVLLAVPRPAAAQFHGSPPSNLVAQATNCSVSLTWDAPATDAATVDGYRVLRARGSEALSTLVADTGSTATNYTDLVLRPGETYSYQVRAVRNGPASPSSNLVEAAIPAGPTPTDVTVEAAPIVVTSTTADYFVLYVKHSVDGAEMEAPVAVVRGKAGTTTLSENVAALPRERYRVEKYLIANPADVDRDCTDDITELGNPSSMNPVNPAGQIAMSDGAVAIPDRTTFEALSLEKSDRGHLKFSLLGMDTDRPRLYFQNTNTHPHHGDFLRAVGLPHDQEYVRGDMIYDPSMVAADGSHGVYRFWVGDQFSTDYSLGPATRAYTLLAAGMPLLTDNLAFWIPGDALLQLQSEMPMYRASRMNLAFDEDIYTCGQLRGVEPGGRVRLAAEYGPGRSSPVSRRRDLRDAAERVATRRRHHQHRARRHRFRISTCAPPRTGSPTPTSPAPSTIPPSRPSSAATSATGSRRTGGN